MKQIDANPNDYRRTNPETGRVEYPIDRKLCFWLGLAGLGFVVFMVWKFYSEGGDAWLIIGPSALSLVSGALLALTIRRLNW